jgi:ketosteroid isomerase-like protein
MPESTSSLPCSTRVPGLGRGRLTSVVRPAALALVMALGAAGCAAPPQALPPVAERSAELRAAETAFARSMADRDFAAFGRHIADDAVFVNGGKPLRGKAAILAHWRRFFEAPAAPFSWKPEVAEVSGAHGYTEGPVSAPDGTPIARFHSTWQRGADGRWLVIFDNGTCICGPARSQ